MRKIIISGILVTFILMGCKSVEPPKTVEIEEIDSYQIEEVACVEGVEIIEKDVESDDWKTETFCITAYCPCELCCGKSDGITATGTVATEGRTIAVDPSVIPYGTEVVINGHTYIAEDCGGAICGNRIDIFFDSHQAALNWGVQYLEVDICEM